MSEYGSSPFGRTLRAQGALFGSSSVPRNALRAAPTGHHKLGASGNVPDQRPLLRGNSRAPRESSQFESIDHGWQI